MKCADCGYAKVECDMINDLQKIANKAGYDIFVHGTAWPEISILPKDAIVSSSPKPGMRPFYGKGDKVIGYYATMRKGDE